MKQIRYWAGIIGFAIVSASGLVGSDQGLAETDLSESKREASSIVKKLAENIPKASSQNLKQSLKANTKHLKWLPETRNCLKCDLGSETSDKVLSESGTQLSYNPAHLRQWLETGSCRDCNLRGVNLSSQKVLSRFVRREESFARAAENGELYLNRRTAGDGMDLSSSDLSGANLSNVDLSGTSFAGAKLIGTNFRGAKLHEVEFASADLRNADFTNADMKYIQISYARNVPSAKLAHKWVLIWELFHVGAYGRNLSNEDFSYAIFQPTPPHSESPLYPNFTGANLKGANFKGSTLSGCHFRLANLQGADFSDAKIKETDFSGSDLKRASFKGTLAEGLNFSDADLRSVNFERFLGRIKIRGAKLEGIKCGGKRTGANCFLYKQFTIDKEN
jgi:uncharacterized protein YjbI with pentapeptide repeats